MKRRGRPTTATPGRSGDDPDATEPIVPVEDWQSPDLGAPIWSQPLILGSRAYVATVGDEIYALNVATGEVVWEKSVGTPVPSGELPCGDVTPTVGIVGTPVIDASSQVIYAVADTWNPATKEAHHVLKGLSLASGTEVLSTPVDPPGSDPKAILQRTALNLDAGNVVFGFGGNDGDCSDYRGAVVSAPESGGARRCTGRSRSRRRRFGAGRYGRRAGRRSTAKATSTRRRATRTHRRGNPRSPTTTPTAS